MFMATTEIFRTNVEDAALAEKIIRIISENFAGHEANFDLSDCDRILRVVNMQGEIQATAIIETLSSIGLFAEILPW